VLQRVATCCNVLEAVLHDTKPLSRPFSRQRALSVSRAQASAPFELSLERTCAFLVSRTLSVSHIHTVCLQTYIYIYIYIYIFICIYIYIYIYVYNSEDTRCVLSTQIKGRYGFTLSIWRIVCAHVLAACMFRFVVRVSIQNVMNHEM